MTRIDKMTPIPIIILSMVGSAMLNQVFHDRFKYGEPPHIHFDVAIPQYASLASPISASGQRNLTVHASDNLWGSQDSVSYSLVEPRR